MNEVIWISTKEVFIPSKTFSIKYIERKQIHDMLIFYEIFILSNEIKTNKIVEKVRLSLTIV